LTRLTKRARHCIVGRKIGTVYFVRDFAPEGSRRRAWQAWLPSSRLRPSFGRVPRLLVVAGDLGADSCIGRLQGAVRKVGPIRNAKMPPSDESNPPSNLATTGMPEAR